LLALNKTQTSIENARSAGCQSDAPDPGGIRCSSYPGTNDSGEAISPEQSSSVGTNSNKTSSSQTNSANQTVMNRMAILRSGTVTARGSNVQFYNDGKALEQISYAGLTTNKGAASADEYSKLGLWANGIFRFGNVDSTTQESKGYNFNNLGVTIGLDYAISQDFILGTAFTYLSTSGGFVENGGDLQSDLFNGAIYASYNITDDFYIDALAFYGGNNYNITRNVNYAISTGNVNERLEGTPGGRQYGFNLNSGYSFRFQRLEIEPYLGVSYLGTDIDAYNEKSLGTTNSWAAKYDAQNLASLKTTLGALLAYNFDVPWGVLIPQVRGEWHHEFEDHGRAIGAQISGTGENYSIFIENPDRDYFTFGASVASAFDYGITAFLAYDMLIGYNNVSSYGFTLGGRIDF